METSQVPGSTSESSSELTVTPSPLRSPQQIVESPDGILHSQPGDAPTAEFSSGRAIAKNEGEEKHRETEQMTDLLATQHHIVPPTDFEPSSESQDVQKEREQLGERPQRLMGPNQQFIDNRSKARTTDYHEALDKLHDLIFSIKIEIQRGPIDLDTASYYTNKLHKYSRTLIERAKALNYILPFHEYQADYTSIQEDKASLVQALTVSLLPYGLGAESCVEAGDKGEVHAYGELDAENDEHPKVKDHVHPPEATADLSCKSATNTQTETSKPQEKPLPKFIKNPKPTKTASVERSRHSSGSKHSSRRSSRSQKSIISITKKRSDLEAIKVRLQAQPEMEHLQSLRQQALQRKSEEETEMEAEVLKRKVENERKKFEMQAELDAIQLKENQLVQQMEFSATQAYIDKWEECALSDGPSEILESLPRVNPVEELYLKRDEVEYTPVDGNNGDDLPQPRSSTLQTLRRTEKDGKFSALYTSAPDGHLQRHLKPHRREYVHQFTHKEIPTYQMREPTSYSRRSEETQLLKPYTVDEKEVSFDQTVDQHAKARKQPPLNHDAPMFVPQSSCMTSLPAAASVSDTVCYNANGGPNCGPYLSPGLSDTQMLVRSLAEALTISRLPVPKPPVFNGDPLTYPSWIAAFRHLVNSDAVKAEDKMLILREYLDGPAKQAVGVLYYELSEKSYHSALEILHKRFGRDITIAESLREKLENWPNVKADDHGALRDFADYLQQCHVMSGSIRGLSIIEDPLQIRNLLQKLPKHIASSWGEKVTHHENATGTYPEFCTFVEFLQNKCDSMLNSNLKSNHKRLGETESQGRPSNKGGQTFASSAYDANDSQQQSGPTRNTITNAHRGSQFGQRGQRDANVEQGTCVQCRDQQHATIECKEFANVTTKEKAELIRAKFLCYRCLSPLHTVKGCLVRYVCEQCNGNHATVLHELNRNRPARVSPPSDETDVKGVAYDKNENGRGHQVMSTKVNSSEDGQESFSHRTSQLYTPRLFSLYMPVFVSAESFPDNEVLVYAMMDTMSDTSFIVESVAEKLNLDHRDACLILTTLTSDRQTIKCKTYDNLRVRSYDSRDYITVPTAYSQSDISVDRGQIPTCDTIKAIPHLQHLASKFHPLYDAPVALLLGVNASEALRPLQVISGKRGQPYAQETCLGWGLVGEVEGSSNTKRDEGRNIGGSSVYSTSQVILPSPTFSFRAKDVTNDRLVRMIERDFAFPNEEPSSQDDQRFLKTLKENIKINKEGHYELPLPFRSEEPRLPNNRSVAFKRLMSLKRKFEANPEHLRLYTEFMNQMFERNDAEMIPKNEEAPGTVWYIPHHGVYNPNKPGKVRVVFDCAATCRGVSLNDHLLSGPDLMNSLVGVLCRFRLFPVAISCDVERMFHQFHVTPAHRDFIRFLWWPENDLTAMPVDYRMRVHLFGAASSPGCANFAFKQLARDNCDVSESASSFIQRDFYVDDGLHSDQNDETATEVLEGARQICEKGKLRLHKIASNSQKVMSSFPETEVVKTSCVERDVEKGEGSVERALGIRWTLDTDMLHFKNEFRDKPLTKRGALSMLASIFDPLGLVSPVVLKGRLILQETCKEGLDWDDALPQRLLELWNDWVKDLKMLSSIQIPRCYFNKAEAPWSHAELHHFADASSCGYGECSYLRVIDKSGTPHCALVIAKAKVAPIKTVTIPRLELQAAVLAVRVAQFLQREFEGVVTQHHFWTDSRVVLGYIYNETKRFHVYVANRIQQIRDFSKPQQWHHVTTEQNPADHASRGFDVQSLRASNWQTGPQFLSHEPVHYEAPEVTVSEEDKEVKAYHSKTTVKRNGLEEIVERFSSLSQLLGVMTRMMSWVSRARRTMSKTKSTPSKRLEDEDAAFKRIVKLLQAHHYPEKHRQNNADLLKLDIMTDDEGVMRVGGRIRQSAEPFHTKHPIILPCKCHLSLLLIRHHHVKVAHQGRTTTLGSLRSAGIWICGARKVASTLIQKCVRCSRLRGKPESQKMADLPTDRVEESPPFTHTGLDCFGPFLVSAGRRSVKRYGLILTCMASRAVHLEVLEDMSTDAFICGLRRFIAIRGNVRTIRCDRGTNFVGAERELRQAWRQMDSDKVSAEMKERSCEFHFNPPSASHFGGVWERLIRQVRQVIQGLLSEHENRLTTDTLPTLFYEVAAIVNNRPLCVESLEDPRSPAPLTPNHLLTIKPEPVFPPPGNFKKSDLYSGKRWRRVQFLVEQFWSRWRVEYLATLQPRKKWHREKDSVQKGMLVILMDEGAPRGTWKIARIEKIYPSDDGLVRSVQLRLPSAQKDGKKLTVQTSFLDRPVHRIIPLHVLPPV